MTFRRPAALALIASLLLAACSSGAATPTPSQGTPGPSSSATPSATGSVLPTGSSAPTPPVDLVSEECQASNLTLLNEGRLTLGTDNPAYPPWWLGDPEPDSIWEGSDPYAQEGFESAVAYAVAHALGFAPADIDWVALGYLQSFAPGPKTFDFYLAQVSYREKRTRAADLSSSYYDVNQAVVALSDNPIAAVTTLEGLKGFKLGAPVGSTSYDTIVDVVDPTTDPTAYDDLDKAVRALKNGQIDGVVADVPSTFYMRDVQLSSRGGVIVGQFPTTGEYFSLVLAKDSPLTACVNEALALIHDNGVWQQIYDEWLAGEAGLPPTFE